ncbi:hypothetical protein D9615_003079 [Tricholomella constricta]|uniref:Uncharacterized protein n=1 Tax=Tricholomella constricta TaxID=117010 RepID=A0A8H5HG20_9AGAR|nr:hypothetical protein D9615_003079 [Tricholomella constricta]
MAASVAIPPQFHQVGSEQIKGIWNSTPSSPATSSSTLVLEDDEIKTFFENQKPNDIAPRDPPLVYGTGATLDLSLKNPLPEGELNPHAAPFIPMLAPKSRRLVRPEVGATLKPLTSRWLRTFKLATRAPIQDKEFHSLIIVGAECWDPESIAKLAQEFCWRAAEASPEDLEAVIVFLLKLHSQFRTMKSQAIADSFEWHIKEFFLGTFLSVWDANNPEGISYKSKPKPSLQYVESAIQLAGVIGELYARGFVEIKNISDCLETLVANFVSVEHADAIAAMVQHAGPSYWFSHPNGPVHLHRFGFAFTTVANKLQGEMSVLEKPRSKEELLVVLRTVDSLWREWSAEMVARMTMQLPKPPSRQLGSTGYPANQGYAQSPTNYMDRRFRTGGY